MKRIIAPLAALAGLSFSFSLAAGDWTQWRGSYRDGHAPPDARFPSSLPSELTPVWKLTIGPGFSSPVVGGGKLVFLDEQEGKETVHAVAADTGKELWKASFDDVYGDEWGSGPRSTPILDADRVYVQSCKGEFQCRNLEDGKLLWQINFEKDYGVKFLGSKANEGTASRRGNNGCGLVEGDRIYVPVGSAPGASVVCFDKRTGKELWRSQNDEAGYSSFMVGTLAGEKQLVAFTADALMGLTLAEGKLLWRVPLVTQAKRHAASPVIMGDHVIVNTFTLGMLNFEIQRNTDGFEARQSWANKELKVNLATPVVVGEHLYVQGPKQNYVCVEAATGKVTWSQPGFGRSNKDYSSTLVAGDRLLILNEAGTLFLVQADPQGFKELSRLQVCGNTWSFPAFAANRLFVRDGRSLICLDLGTGKTAGL